MASFNQYLQDNKTKTMGDVAREIAHQMQNNGPYKNEIKTFLTSKHEVDQNKEFWKNTIDYLNDHDGEEWYKCSHWLLPRDN